MQTFSHKWKNNSQRRSIKIIRPWKFRTNLKIIKFPRTRNLWKRDLMKRNTPREGIRWHSWYLSGGIRRGREEISRESSRHLFIISIRGKQPEAESNKTLSSRKSVYVHTRFHACSPYVTYLHFRTEKEMSVFSSSLVTCAPELCMPHTHPPSLDRYVVRIYRGRWYNRLFISTRFPIFETLCKRSWVIISRLSTRDIAGICLAPLFRKRNFHRSYLSLGYKLRRDLLFSRRSFVFNL